MKKLALLLVFMALIAGHCFASEIGSVQFFMSAGCPSNFVLADGSQIYSSTAPGATWPYKDARSSSFMSSGGGGYQYYLPNLTASERFIRGGVSANVGRLQDDMFQGHGHNVYFNYNNATPGSTAMGGASAGSNTALTTEVNTPVVFGANGTPRYGSETRPINITLLPCVRYAEDSTSGGSVDMSSVTLVNVSTEAAAALQSPGIFDHFTGGDLSFWLGVIVATFVVLGWRSGSR